MRPTKWDEIANIIRNRILDGTYPPGGYFPTTMALMKEFDVYSATIQAAINHLINENFIISAGRGKRIVRPLLKSITKKGLYDDIAFGKLVLKEILLCCHKETRLPKNCDPPVLFLKSVLLNTDFVNTPPPISIIEYFIMAPGKDIVVLDEIESMLRNNPNVFDVMCHFDLIPFSYIEQHTVSNPSEDENNLLRLSTSAFFIPVVRINRCVYNENGELIMVCNIVDRADCFVYEFSSKSI